MTTPRKPKEKTTATDAALDPAIVETPVAAAPRTKRVRVNRTETFIEPVIEPEQRLTDDDDDGDAGYDDFESNPEPMSAADILIAEAKDDTETILVVERLPNFEKDRRTDTRAEREYCTTFTPPTLDYRERVKQEFGPGRYLFSIYKRGQGCQARWSYPVGKSLRDQMPMPQSSAAIVTPAPAPDSLETFTKQAGQLAVVMQALGYERPTPAQTAATATPPVPVDPTDQFMTNLEKYMTLTERLSPVREANGGASRSIIGDIAELIREAGTHGKALAPLLATMIAPHAIQSPPPPAQPPQPTPLRDATAATPPVPPPVPPPTPVNPFEPTLKIILEDLTANAPHRRAIDAIDDLYASNPELEETLDALWDLPASELVGAFAQMTGAHYLLSAEWMPHSLRWTDELQKVFNHDDAEDSAVPAADADSSTDAVQATG